MGQDGGGLTTLVSRVTMGDGALGHGPWASPAVTCWPEQDWSWL